MSNPAAPNQDLPPIDPQIGLMFTAADHLIPLFKTGSIDTSLARQMAISAIDAYHPESRADYVNIARTIAFSMAALALLGQATAQDMTTTEKMRALGRATALNRSADQSERTMMQRRRYLHANPPAEQPDPAIEPNAAEMRIDDAQMQAEIAGAMKEYLATRTSSNTQAASEAPPSPVLVAPGTVAPHGFGAVRQSGSAIHHNVTQPGSNPLRATSHKHRLPHQGAMQQGASQDGALQPAEAAILRDGQVTRLCQGLSD